MIQPRNTLVVVKLFEQTEQKVGKISVMNLEEQYTEAEIIAVGPGIIQAAGGRSDVFDLIPGQRVLIKHKERDPATGGRSFKHSGIKIVEGDSLYYIYDQVSVVGIVAVPQQYSDAKSACIDPRTDN